MTRIDHVVMATSDLELGAAQLQHDFGLATEPGGRHPRFGTINRLMPMDEQYLELVAVADPERAASNPFGRAVAAAARYKGMRALAVCLQGPDLEAVAGRLGLPIEAGSRITPDGVDLSWRTVGMAEAFSQTQLPFFIAWDSRATHPSRANGNDRLGSARLTRVEIGGNPEEVTKWVGGEVPGLIPIGGSPGIRSVVIAMADGGTVTIR